MSDPVVDWRAVEALLFASAEPLTEAAIADALTDGVGARPGLDAVGRAISRIAKRHAGSGIVLTSTGAGHALRTDPAFATLLRREREVAQPLSRAAAEVLAIIAYHGPVTRAEIEAIRGVQTAPGSLDVLVGAGWVAPGPRRQTPGRPVTFATTPAFLDQFGLVSLADLPRIEEWRAAGLLGGDGADVGVGSGGADDNAGAGEPGPVGTSARQDGSETD